MFASMIFRKEPFFHGHDNYDQVIYISYPVIDLRDQKYLNSKATFRESHQFFKIWVVIIVRYVKSDYIKAAESQYIYCIIISEEIILILLDIFH